METTDITTQILIDIRDELRGLNKRVDDTNTRIDVTNARLEEMSRRIDRTNRQLLSTETRLATEISALRAAVNDNENRSLAERLDRVEHDIAELRARAP